MTVRLAFYVHHHGRGHVSRTRAILDEVDLPATVLTSAPDIDRVFDDVEVVILDRDDAESTAARQPPLPPHLHHAPSGVPGLRRRMARIAAFLADAAPLLLVVDVSCEVAQLARSMGIPTVVVRQHGNRWDIAHLAAYDGAVALLAPFGPELEEPDVPDRVRARTFYAGGLARAGLDARLRRSPTGGHGPVPGSHAEDGRVRRRGQLGWGPRTRGVALLLGTGGHEPDPARILAAAGATPGHRWVVIGEWKPDGSDVSGTGWVDDPLPWLDAADLVVGSGGHNTVMEAATAGRSFVCVPQDRPYDEQGRKAARLRALDLAEVVDTWPEDHEWPDVLRRAERRSGTGLATVVDPEAAGRTARWLTALATSYAA